MGSARGGPRSRAVVREDQRLVVELGEWGPSYGFQPQWDDRARTEPYFEPFSMEAVGAVIRPAALLRALRPTVRLSLYADRRIDLSPKGQVPKAIGSYQVNKGEIAASVYVPFDSFTALGPWALAGRLGWATLVLSYPEHQRGYVQHLDLDAACYPDD
jgi:hypothetical protein